MIKKQFSLIVVMMSLLTTFSVLAEQDKLKVSGFATLASATADTRNHQFRTDRSQAEIAKKTVLPLNL